MNKYFNYDGIELWGKEPWEGRESSIGPLVWWIQENDRELAAKTTTPSKYAGRTDGIYNSHTKFTTIPDVIKYWDDKGLHFYSDHNIGGSWMIFVPKDLIGKYNNTPKILLVFVHTDYADPMWAMDVLDKYKEYNEMAAKEGYVIIYYGNQGKDEKCWYCTTLEEVAVMFFLNYDNLYLDLSSVYNNGQKISTIPGFTLKDEDGNVIEDLESRVEHFGSLNIPAINIDGIWSASQSLIHMLVTSGNTGTIDYDSQALIHSDTGRRMAQWLKLEHDFRKYTDEGIPKYWENMGVKYDSRFTNGVHWVILAPMSVKDEPEKKLPLMIVLQEVQTANKHHTLKGLSYCWEYCNIAAQGECIVLECVLETADGNDMIMDFLEEAKQFYPIDETRIYVTGHSHNGTFSREFSRRHHNVIAALATLGNLPGLNPPANTGSKQDLTQEMLDEMETYDMPTINLSGYCEKSMFPLSTDADRLVPSERTAAAISTFDERAESWQRRLKAYNCPMVTKEQIKATLNSDDCVERMLGIPCDKSEVLFLDGFENYIADIKNNEGKYHLRIVCLGGMPHTTTPAMLDLAWSFMRRFSRDLNTGKIIELY